MKDEDKVAAFSTVVLVLLSLAFFMEHRANAPLRAENATLRAQNAMFWRWRQGLADSGSMFGNDSLERAMLPCDTLNAYFYPRAR